MGKPKVDRMNQMNRSHNTQKGDMTTPMFYTPLESDEDAQSEEIGLPQGLTLYRNQVSGHSDKIGLVKCNENLMKPIPQQRYFEREVHFYESLQRVQTNDCSCNPDFLITKLVPKYFGRNVVQVNGNNIQCVVLEDLTRGMREPCVMDVKIGKRTWDPEATLEKINNENSKYQKTKGEYGISVTGFQVFDVNTGEKKKYDKVFGKQLDKDTIIDALKCFLNGCDKRISRNLLVQLLVNLWHIQHWARKQTNHRLYSSSILLIYDARRLRQSLGNCPIKPVLPPPPPPATTLKRTNSLYRPLSLAILNDKCTKTGFSGQLNKDGPIFPCFAKHKFFDCRNQQEISSRKSAPNLKRMHSFHNNYDEELQSIRSDYTNILEDLVEDTKSELWATARMIDFAHAFPADNCKVDYNYLNGIENLVKILESFLVDSEG